MITVAIKYMVLTILVSLNIYAGSTKTDAQINIEIFDGLCAQNSDDFTNIKHMVKVFGGKELNASIKNMDPVLRKKGGELFIVPYKKRKFMVGYTHNGGCSIGTDRIDHKNLSNLIVTNYSAKLIDTLSAGVQVTKYFRINKKASQYGGSVISLMYAKEEVNSSSGTIGFIPNETVEELLRQSNMINKKKQVPFKTQNSGMPNCKAKIKDYMFAVNMVDENIQKQNTSLIKYYTKEKIRISYEVEKACNANIVGEEQAKKMHEGMIFDRNNAQKTLKIIEDLK